MLQSSSSISEPVAWLVVPVVSAVTISSTFPNLSTALSTSWPVCVAAVRAPSGRARVRILGDFPVSSQSAGWMLFLESVTYPALMPWLTLHATPLVAPLGSGFRTAFHEWLLRFLRDVPTYLHITAR